MAPAAAMPLGRAPTSRKTAPRLLRLPLLPPARTPRPQLHRGTHELPPTRPSLRQSACARRRRPTHAPMRHASRGPMAAVHAHASTVRSHGSLHAPPRRRRHVPRPAHRKQARSGAIETPSWAIPVRARPAAAAAAAAAAGAGVRAGSRTRARGGGGGGGPGGSCRPHRPPRLPRHPRPTRHGRIV
jgi:hypothetical protein